MDPTALAPAPTGKSDPPKLSRRSVPESTDDLLRSVWEGAATELSRLVCAMGVDSDRAQDVLHDVYLTALGKRPPSADAVGLRRWLFRVTTNRCNLEHRRQARWRNVLGRFFQRSRDDDQTHDALHAAGLEEERVMVRAALDRLEPPLRSVLVLRYFAEFDSKEIGRILDMPDSTVRSRLRAARNQLALELKRAGYASD